MAWELFRYVGTERLRCGYTTGTCAALAAQVACAVLLGDEPPLEAKITTPSGVSVVAPVQECACEAGAARCAVRKFGGDDYDATDGLLVCAEVALESEPGVRIEGGPGVGRVTLPGLEQPVGAAAINSVPRRMISEEVQRVLDAHGVPGGARVTVSVPGGEDVGRKTFNPHVGIVGGISILGTSGIVEPRSLRALWDSIEVEIAQKAAVSDGRLVLVPGNYGEAFAETLPVLDGVARVSCSNFIGAALDSAARNGFSQVLLVGHIGKMAKVAGGVMDTHSRTADCRSEIFCAHAACAGASAPVARALMDAATTDACIGILKESNLFEPVMESIALAVQQRLDRRAAGAFETGAILFSKTHGELARTHGARSILDSWEARHG